MLTVLGGSTLATKDSDFVQVIAETAVLATSTTRQEDTHDESEGPGEAEAQP
jgi:hypothetical protein